MARRTVARHVVARHAGLQPDTRRLSSASCSHPGALGASGLPQWRVILQGDSWEEELCLWPPQLLSEVLRQA